MPDASAPVTSSIIVVMQALAERLSAKADSLDAQQVRILGRHELCFASPCYQQPAPTFWCKAINTRASPTPCFGPYSSLFLSSPYRPRAQSTALFFFWLAFKNTNVCQVVYALASLAQLRADGAIGWRDEALARLARRCVVVVNDMSPQDLVCTVIVMKHVCKVVHFGLRCSDCKINYMYVSFTSGDEIHTSCAPVLNLVRSFF